MDLGLEYASPAEKSTVLNLLRDIDIELNRGQMNVRTSSTRQFILQRIQGAIPQMPASIQNMNFETATDRISEFLRVYRVFMHSQGNSSSMEVPASRLHELPSSATRPLTAPSHETVTNTAPAILQLAQSAHDDSTSQSQIPQDVRSQRPEQTWGPPLHIWSEEMSSMTLDKLQATIRVWFIEQERRLDRFILYTMSVRAILIADPETYDPAMLLGLQTERHQIVVGWQEWMARAKAWYTSIIEWKRRGWTPRQMRQDEGHGDYRRVIVGIQQGERYNLQKRQSVLITRANWVEHLYDNPPSLDVWRLLCEWNENGFDFSSLLVVFNLQIDIVRASDGTILCTESLDQFLQVLDQCDTTVQVSIDGMWVDITYLDIERLEENLYQRGIYNMGDQLWWSPRTLDTTGGTNARTDLNHALFQDRQTHLVDRDSFLLAVSTTFAGPWAHFSGPIAQAGRHGPFDASSCPRAAIIIRQGEPIVAQNEEPTHPEHFGCDSFVDRMDMTE